MRTGNIPLGKSGFKHSTQQHSVVGSKIKDTLEILRSISQAFGGLNLQPLD